jgi:hypothetical protein
MRRVRQTVVADPRRRDGYATDGTPGDCLRAAVASLLDLDLFEVPHFGLYGPSWWQTMRRWARRTLGQDFAALRPHGGSVAYALPDYDNPDWSGLMIGNGPSPRGPWRHVVIVDRQLALVHDPHPSDRGLTRVDEVFVVCDPYDQHLAPQWKLTGHAWPCHPSAGCEHCDPMREAILAEHGEFTGPMVRY